MTRNVPISEIRVGQRKRKLDPERVAQLAESIGEVGLLNPITISPDKCLRAGWHRLEACKRRRARERYATQREASIRRTPEGA